MKFISLYKWYKDEPWYAIFKDAYLGLYLGFNVGFQCFREARCQK